MAFLNRTLSRSEFMNQKPYTGKLWMDAVIFIVIASIQQHLRLTLFGIPFHLDLVTPWLVMIFVETTLLHSFFLSLAAGLFLETQGSVPSGVYVTIYLMLGIMIHLTRNTLSWRHQFPWIVTLVLSMIWTVGFERFVVWMEVGQSALTKEEWGLYLARILAGTLIGILFIRSSYHQEFGNETRI